MIRTLFKIAVQAQGLQRLSLIVSRPPHVGLGDRSAVPLRVTTYLHLYIHTCTQPLSSISFRTYVLSSEPNSPPSVASTAKLRPHRRNNRCPPKYNITDVINHGRNCEGESQEDDPHGGLYNHWGRSTRRKGESQPSNHYNASITSNGAFHARTCHD